MQRNTNQVIAERIKIEDALVFTANFTGALAMATYIFPSINLRDITSIEKLLAWYGYVSSIALRVYLRFKNRLLMADAHPVIAVGCASFIASAGTIGISALIAISNYLAFQALSNYYQPLPASFILSIIKEVLAMSAVAGISTGVSVGIARFKFSIFNPPQPSEETPLMPVEERAAPSYGTYLAQRAMA